MSVPGIWPSKRLSEVKRQSVEWLWSKYLAVGKLHCFFGGGGLGKTMIAVDLAATVTTGRPWPDEAAGCAVGTVAYITAEDGIGDTIRPRLEAAGGDTSRVVVLDSIFSQAGGAIKHFNLSDPECMCHCEATLADIADLRLFIIDPVTAFLGKMDSHKIGDVRKALLPLTELAERLSIAVVFIHHVNKAQGQKAVHRASGSTAFTDAVRVALMVDGDPSDPEGEYIFQVVKSNIGEKAAGIAYRIRAVPELSTAKVHWEGPVEDKGSGSVSMPQIPSVLPKREKSSVVFLREALADDERLAVEVLAEGKEAGFSEKEIRTAREYLQITPRKVGYGKDGKFIWRLPDIQ